MPPELKQQIAGMPLFLATLRMSWPGYSESVKAQYRTQWGGELKAILPRFVTECISCEGGVTIFLIRK